MDSSSIICRYSRSVLNIYKFLEKSPIILLQLFIADPLDLLFFLLGQLLPYRLVHLNHAQGLGVVEHLHILEPLKGVGQDIPLGLGGSVAALGVDAVGLFHHQAGRSAGPVELRMPNPVSLGGWIGSAGPTTSGRMDAYAPTMMSVGARGMIGKGARLPEVVDAMKKYSGVYFGAIGGAGALLAKCIKKCELIAYEDLGAEALRKLYVEDMPLVVIIDSEGNNLYDDGRKAYLKDHEA